MPRKAFIEHLQQAVQYFECPRVSEVSTGVEDGSLTFKYRLEAPTDTIIPVHALVTDVGSYPSSHMYMVYTTAENIPAHISTALEDVAPLEGLDVSQMLSKVARVLDAATAGFKSNPLDLDDDDLEMDDHDLSPPELDEESDEDSLNPWSPKSPEHNPSASVADRYKASLPNSRPFSTSANRRIRSDLRAAKAAGFRVGHLGSLMDGAQLCIITLSIRVSKLGVSEEAMQAWHLDPNQYLILLIRYTAGYRPMEDLFGSDGSRRSPIVSFRVGLCQRYKVSLDAAVKAFSEVKKMGTSANIFEELEGSAVDKSNALRPLFIDRPLQDLLNERLVPIVNYRYSLGFLWNGAEAWYIDRQGCTWSSSQGVDKKYYAPEFSSRAAALPKLVTDDHIAKSLGRASFPLAAMQFTLRHLVRCTDFCLVCHSPVEVDFEALKPYVCSKPLCLYQYMAFGFGPSIEHDIISQPHVVDLLISFCYASAEAARLKNLPNGMSLGVPAPSLLPNYSGGIPTHYGPLANPEFDDIKEFQNPNAVKPAHQVRSYKAKFDESSMELFLPPGESVLHANQWIFLQIPGKEDEQWHCRVIEALHPTIRLGPPVNRTKFRIVRSSLPENIPPLNGPSWFSNNAATSSVIPGSSKHTEVEFTIYDQNFDDLPLQDKQQMICVLLNTLPSVAEMKVYLESRDGKNMTVASWQDRVSPAAAGVLRWIIASNRSCIVQVDRIERETTFASEQRVAGIPGWMQFRFAQGAPDKEQRFIRSIRDVTGEMKHPSLYAWHGSPLANWHSIVREGLHFQDTAHGRAFGHGVYHSSQAMTSLSYSGMHHYRTSREASNALGSTWPHSQLMISQAIALNEIVNAPNQFVSKHPHLVVAQLDWIQTRYLFIKINSSVTFGSEVMPSKSYEQDPAYVAVGPSGQKVVIPITAVSKSRRPVSVKTIGEKKMKIGDGLAADDAIVLSDDTDVEDLKILLSDDEDDGHALLGSKEKPVVEKPLPRLPQTVETDYVPGMLDETKLPLLEPPAYATTMATKALQRELNSTIKVQDSQPAHELGWYISRDLISNMYQWIVELHSFDAKLPIAEDLKSKGLKSVIMEIRFGKDYPMSPPFVRIIRPRFLSFMAGGGGHVTAGGALCMELLTNSGWSAVSNMESVLLQVRLALSSTEPKPARLEPGLVRDYGVREAIQAYIRACHAHGWAVPPDFLASHANSDALVSNDMDGPIF
ncbi:MAG: hypothetical protein L6R37_002391 [Teloschistes peruensis]|nr:MAG: hypothetical protein L6R37_002391 [Teloschistes peruensis]